MIGPPLLDARDVTVRYGGVTAVDRASVHVDTGEIVALIGPNGAGKTSLFNALTGVVRPASGTIRLCGLSVDGYAPHERARLGMGRTFQHAELFQRFTVRENLVLAHYGAGRSGLLAGLLGSATARRDRDRAERRADELLAATDLMEHADTPCAELPYGLQRVATVARALVVPPKVLLLDEPSAGLGPSESEELAATITRIRDLLHIPVLLIEHNMELVMGVADYVYVLDFGIPLAEGRPDDVQNDPVVLRAYLGADDDAEDDALVG